MKKAAIEENEPNTDGETEPEKKMEGEKGLTTSLESPDPEMLEVHASCILAKKVSIFLLELEMSFYHMNPRSSLCKCHHD